MSNIEDMVITINGHTLSDAQKMTLNVCIDSMYADLNRSPNKLGDDTLADMIAEGYRKNLRDLILMLGDV